MSINISGNYSYQLENRELLKDTAKNILAKSGASESKVAEIAEKAIFNSAKSDLYTNSQLSILKASTQISINNTLKETLKYLKTHATQKHAKQPMLGELWNIFNANNETAEKNPYRGELFDFKIDKNAKNIFAA